MGLLDFKLNSSPRPKLSSPGTLLLARPTPHSSECPWSAQLKSPYVERPTPESPWSAQPGLCGVPNPRVSPECQAQSLPQPTPESPECPTPDCPSASLPRVPNPRVSGVPSPESPCSAEPHILPGVPNRRVSLSARVPWSAQP